MVFLPSERTGGNIMKKEIETKICSCCGKELKLNKFIKNRRLCKVGFRREYKTSYQSVCKDCRNEKRQNTLKEKGMSLYEGLMSLYEKYGFFKEKTISITLKGIEGLAKIKDIISYFRENEVSSMGDFKVIDMKDYSKGVDGLPKADVLKFFLEDGSWVAIRPSGTEPKLKFYIAVKGIDENEATNKLNNINKYIDATVNSLVIENKEAASKLFC